MRANRAEELLSAVVIADGSNRFEREWGESKEI